MDREIKRILENYGVVSLSGPWGCGKTTSLRRYTEQIGSLTGPSERFVLEGTRQADAGPRFFGRPRAGDRPHLPGERNTEKSGHVFPGDASRGSAGTPCLRMHTMSLFETGDSNGSVRLRDLMAGVKIRTQVSAIELADFVALTCFGGWPRGLSMPPASRVSLPASYLNAALTAQLATGEKKPANADKFQFVVELLAETNASVVKNADLLDEMRHAEESLSASVLSGYIRYLKAQFILEEFPGWSPPAATKTRLLTSPKRMLADPSLAAAALGLSPDHLMKDFSEFGPLFKGICLRDLAVYAESMGAAVFHYLDSTNLQVDAIVETTDGRWGAFDFQLSGRGVEQSVRSLLHVSDKMIRQHLRPPQCLVVVTTTGIAMHRDDGITIVPIIALRN